MLQGLGGSSQKNKTPQIRETSYAIPFGLVIIILWIF
jgi:hypothetical protein